MKSSNERLFVHYLDGAQRIDPRSRRVRGTNPFACRLQSSYRSDLEELSCAFTDGAWAMRPAAPLTERLRLTVVAKFSARIQQMPSGAKMPRMTATPQACMESFISALIRQDIDAALPLLTDDVALFYSNGTAIWGKRRLLTRSLRAGSGSSGIATRPTNRSGWRSRTLLPE